MRVNAIDFLRGVAIILVMLSHVNYIPLAHKIGWAGVDLFFVISGFLVSGLLFKEEIKSGKIDGKLFLIRRAFKIYPLFWLVLTYTVVIHYFTGFGSDKFALLAELFFFQNYHIGLIGVSWSLAIEEHFYLILTLAIFLFTKLATIRNIKTFNSITIFILLTVLIIRFAVSHFYKDFNPFIHFSPTHMRIDSLVAGVMLSYHFHYNKINLQNFIQRYKFLLVIIAIICLGLIFIFSNESYFMRTVGYSTTYLGFTLVLTLLLFNVSFFKRKENKVLHTIYSILVKIGTWSYALYLVHMPVLIIFRRLTERMKVFEANAVSMLLFYNINWFSILFNYIYRAADT